MKKKVLASFTLLLLMNPFMHAQVKDAQVWENLIVEKNITPKFVARIVQEGRLTENITTPTYNYFDMGVSYKLNKHMHFTLAYVWAEKKVYNDFWMPRHQIYGTVTFRKKWNDFMFLDRQMFLWQTKNNNTSDKGGLPDYYLRNKLTIRYDKSFRWAPYIASEIYYNINSPEVYPRYRFDRIRYFAGLFYRPDNINEFEAYYMIEKNMRGPDEYTKFVIGLGYSHSF